MIFSNQLIKKVKIQKQGNRQILAPIIIKSYNGLIKREVIIKEKRKQASRRKNC
jgi:hypothetical protein